MLINFQNPCYLEEWDHSDEIRKIRLLFQICYTSGFPASCMPISPTVARAGMWASPWALWRKYSHVRSLHAIVCPLLPPLFLHSLVLSNWWTTMLFFLHKTMQSYSITLWGCPWGQFSGSQSLFVHSAWPPVTSCDPSAHSALRGTGVGALSQELVNQMPAASTNSGTCRVVFRLPPAKWR